MQSVFLPYASKHLDHPTVTSQAYTSSRCVRLNLWRHFLPLKWPPTYTIELTVSHEAYTLDRVNEKWSISSGHIFVAAAVYCTFSVLRELWHRYYGSSFCASLFSDP